ncbi:cache domain-containing protein [Pseudanabaena sp. UWO310]|uniref:cache domain-containing protein n=1 Tax=Pseudanabaena sp. UWO310 TaxID=2480795 RepID=UPI0011583F62|nr:cache domain-containing protein [Pseudanabaena sp. UWO310]TYQ27912.1 HAMP domain-containing protein [Pseudanabaena sp. UWO310]
MNIKWKSQLLLFMVAITTSVVSAYSGFGASNAMIESAKKRELNTTATLIQSNINEQINKASARASLVSSLPSIKQAFRAKDRDAIATRLLPAMIVQRDQFGVREGQFILPPASSFLRIYALKDGHGEDLSGFRQMVLVANRTGEPQRGMEIGRRGLSIRAVYPVKDDDGLIGSFEIGLSFSSVLTQTKTNTGFDVGVFIDDKLMTEVAQLIPRPDNERIVGGYQAVEVTDWTALKPLLSPAIFAKVRDVSTELITLNGNDYGLVLVPVLDYKGERIGAVVAVRDFSEFQIQQRWALTGNIAMAALQIVLLTGALLIVVNAMLLKPFEAIANASKDLAEGKPSSDLEDLAVRKDEIGDMARSLQTLQASDNDRNGYKESQNA